MAEKLRIHDRVGRPSKPVVMVLTDSEVYFDSIREAAKGLLEIKGLDRSITNVGNRISLSCSIRGRKVYGVPFRFATEEEIKKNRGEL